MAPFWFFGHQGFQNPPLVINRHPRLIPDMPHAERIKSSGRFSHGLIPFSMLMLSVPKENATEKRIFTPPEYPEPFSVMPVHSASFLKSGNSLGIEPFSIPFPHFLKKKGM